MGKYKHEKLVTAIALATGIAAAQSAPVPSNIIYIMLDDADYFDVGYTGISELGTTDVSTPNIDALRAGGKAFSQFYAASAICTPTRASVLTGKMPLAVGAIDAWPQIDRISQTQPGNRGLDRTDPQLGHLMKGEGLSTAHFGK